MIEYLVLGIGVFLVMVSVIYTYIVDRKINKFPEQLENRAVGELFADYSGPEKHKALSQVTDIQIKETVHNLGGELDDLIQELRVKEEEIKRIVNKARKWNSELSDPVFTEILEKKIAYQEANHFIHKLYKEQATTKGQESQNTVPDDKTVLDSKDEVKPEAQPVEKVVLSKYDKIKELMNQGLTIEEIAKQLNMGYREVELVVKMSKKGADTGA